MVQMQDNRNFIDDLRKVEAAGRARVRYFRVLATQSSPKTGPMGGPAPIPTSPVLTWAAMAVMAEWLVSAAVDVLP